MDLSGWLRKQLEQASPDLLPAKVQEFAEALMAAEADALSGASSSERSPERINIRNGYRERAWDTRVETIELASHSSANSPSVTLDGATRSPRLVSIRGRRGGRAPL